MGSTCFVRRGDKALFFRAYASTGKKKKWTWWGNPQSAMQLVFYFILFYFTFYLKFPEMRAQIEEFYRKLHADDYNNPNDERLAAMWLLFR